MKKTIVWIVLLGVVAGAIYIGYTYVGSPGGAAAVPYVLPALTQSYTNDAYRFSLTMPADFSATETDDDTGHSVALQNSSGDGIQILISPFDEDTGSGYTLTKERILQDVPDMQISDEQPVTVGSAYTGLAFKSNNQAFSGDSREVWFVFKGNLYQISTYARLDPLLKSVFNTWKFE